MLRISQTIATDNNIILCEDFITVLTGNNANLLTKHCEENGLNCESSIQEFIDMFYRIAESRNATKFSYIVSESTTDRLDSYNVDEIKSTCNNNVVFVKDKMFKDLRDYEYNRNEFNEPNFEQIGYTKLCDCAICAVDENNHNVATLFCVNVDVTRNGNTILYMNIYYSNTNITI